MQNDSEDEALTPVPLSRLEAMELAIRTAVIAHLILCVLSLLVMAMVLEQGLFVGLAVAAAMAFAIPFIVLPVAAVIGIVAHLAFHGTRLSLPVLIRTLVVLFDTTLFGWLVILILTWL